LTGVTKTVLETPLNSALFMFTYKGIDLNGKNKKSTGMQFFGVEAFGFYTRKQAKYSSGGGFIDF